MVLIYYYIGFLSATVLGFTNKKRLNSIIISPLLLWCGISAGAGFIAGIAATVSDESKRSSAKLMYSLIAHVFTGAVVGMMLIDFEFFSDHKSLAIGITSLAAYYGKTSLDIIYKYMRKLLLK